MSHLKFSKMHGLGNDFIVINAIDQAVSLTADQVRWLSDRHFGIGCDQLLLVEAAQSEEADFRYRIFNADGGEVAQCGNGARCFARFVKDNGLTEKETICVETASGLIYPEIQANGEVTVNMGPPIFVPEQIPFDASQISRTYSLEIEAHENLNIVAVSMGNPHAVTIVNDVERAPVIELGPLVEQHKRFPERVNVGFMEVVSRECIKLRVYERGAGETSACGTGACAAAVAGIQLGLLENEVTVALPGGNLVINWAGTTEPVYMTGPTEHVFDGEIEWAKINQQ